VKRKHCELIKAWADGAEIQYKKDGEWITVADPMFSIEVEYRIKPEEKKPVVRWLWLDENNTRISPQLFSEEENEVFGWPRKLEWSRTEFPE